MLIDSTLREGEQLYRAYYDARAKRRILDLLGRLGVEEIEAGWAGKEDLAQTLADARQAAPNAAISVWVPCREPDPAAFPLALVHRINMGVPVSDAHREKRLGIGREELLSRVAAMVAAWRKAGAGYVSVGLEDISRADLSFALEAGRTALRAGASRVRISDTAGLLCPSEMSRLARLFKSALACELAVHCHNDFGMAAANALSALDAGADYADVSALGSGERAGIAPLEQAAAYLTLRRGRKEYDLMAVKALCALVSDRADIAVSRIAPVAGADIFACESGLHVHAMARDPALFEPYPPEAVEASRIAAVGKKSGKAAVRLVLRDLGVEVDEDSLPGLTADIRRLSAQLERPLTCAETLTLAGKALDERERDGGKISPGPARPLRRSA